MYPTVRVPDSPSRKTQFLAPLAFRGPRSDQSTDPGITGPRGGGSPQETTLAEQRGDAGRRDPGLRPREEPERPSPRGDRREPERGSRGEGAAGPGPATNTSLRCTTHSALPSSDFLSVSWETGSSWHVICLQGPSSVQLSPRRKMRRSGSCSGSIESPGAQDRVKRQTWLNSHPQRGSACDHVTASEQDRGLETLH